MFERPSMLIQADSYKDSHFLQYPPGTQTVSSYIEPRKNPFDIKLNMFFGLQMFLKNIVPLCHENKLEIIDFNKAHGVPCNEKGIDTILKRYMGALPLEISALPEGLLTRPGIPQVQVVNTDPEAFWLTSFIETALLRAVWYPSTVATLSWQCKQIIRRYLEETSDDTSGLAFKLHDFGARGTTSSEQAQIGGAAHLVNFMGSDTKEGIWAARRYYAESMAGFSIPAAEHSTITSWGKSREVDAYRNMLDSFPNGLVAVVSDSYDLHNAVDFIWGRDLKKEVIERGSRGGCLVVRPDSGEPREIVLDVVQSLMNNFGYKVNSKGYCVLPPYLRVIQGDGVNIHSIQDILQTLKDARISTDNIVFGMGGKLLQGVDRDTLGYAMKCNAVMINGGWQDVFKDPATDPGKRSKAGVQAVVKAVSPSGQVGYRAVRADCPSLIGQTDLLQPVWRNGELLVDHTFAEIRKRAEEVVYG